MFKVKYNFLVLFQIVFSILNATLLINMYGVSAESDAYLLSCSILVVLQLILTMPIFQFIPFYNDYKNKSIKKSQDFYNFLFMFSLTYGVIVCLFLYFNLDLLIKIFTLNIDVSRLLILKKLLIISIWGSMFYTIVEINTQLLNAEMNFSLPYILNTIPNACVVFVQLLSIYFHTKNIYLLAYGQAISMMISAIIGSFYIYKTLIKFRFVFKFEKIFDFIKNSISMQFGNSIYHIFFPIILNNFLVTTPQGTVSCFYYAKKVIDILNSFALGPSVRILRSKIAKAYSKLQIHSIEEYTRYYICLSIVLFAVGIVFTYFVQVPVLKLVSNNKLTLSELSFIQKIFISLTPWYFFMMIENPYVLINIMSKKSHIITLINSSFIVICATIIFLTSGYFNIYVIGIATAIAQFMNFVLHKKYARKILNSFF